MAGRMRRRAATMAAVFALLAGRAPGQPADAPPLQPGGNMRLGGLTFTMLGLDIRPATTGTLVELRMRALAEQADQSFSPGRSMRLFAAGVPRAPNPFRATWGGDSLEVARISAEDFAVVFRVPERTPDLVLRLEHGGEVVHRRLPGG